MELRMAADLDNVDDGPLLAQLCSSPGLPVDLHDGLGCGVLDVQSLGSLLDSHTLVGDDLNESFPLIWRDPDVRSSFQFLVIKGAIAKRLENCITKKMKWRQNSF